MIKKILFFSTSLCLFLISCKTYEATDLPADRLQFGSGGGFTGMITEYALLKNGQLFTRTGRAGSGEWQELDKVNRSEAKALFQTWQENELFRENIQQPGNLYYFIDMKKDSLAYRQTWGAGDYTPHEDLKSFFSQAMELVKSVTAEKQDP